MLPPLLLTVRRLAAAVPRQVEIEFTGLRTARVYPGELPNLAAGTQQIILGRYLPEGRDQVGEVIVTGRRGGRPIDFSNWLRW